MNLYEHTIVVKQDTSPSQIMKLTEEVKELKEMVLDKWKDEDEQYGEYRWPYDQDGEILPNVNMSGRLN